ncbi:MAG: hypothetical protein JWR10_3270 [Rubritepida sp.]|nr:hypothetical protein [Rubritepida sp.]
MAEFRFTRKNLMAVALGAAVLAAPATGWAQGGGGGGGGGSDSGATMQTQPGADASSRVDRAIGNPPPAVGSPGNPTGQSIDRQPAGGRGVQSADPGGMRDGSRARDPRTTPGNNAGGAGGPTGRSGTPSNTN